MRSLFRALPAYLGGKRRLCPIIFSLLQRVLPRERWPESVLVDPFCGGGAVSLYAKAHGFHVIASDIAERAVVVARALIGNSTCRLRIEDSLDLFREPDGEYPRVAAQHSPSVFNAAQARWLDRALARANRRSEPTRSLLLLVIIKLALRCQPMSMLRGTDARAAATGDLDRVSPRRLGHYVKAGRLLTPVGIWALAQEVNSGVFGGRGEARQGDALEIIGGMKADVLYLDPPFPATTTYTWEYAVLDDLLSDRAVGGEAPDLDCLLDAASGIPVLALSYGGPTITLEGLKALVARHRTVRRALAIPYIHLRSIAREVRHEKNREFLIVAEL